jgi:hypothetical protein
MIHVSGRSVQFPLGYSIGQIEKKVIWDFVNIGDEKHILPVSYEKVMYMRRGGSQPGNCKIHQPSPL